MWPGYNFEVQGSVTVTGPAYGFEVQASVTVTGKGAMFSKVDFSATLIIGLLAFRVLNIRLAGSAGMCMSDRGGQKMESLQAGGGAIVVALMVLWLARLWAAGRKLPPGPFALPVVGNLLHLFGHLPHRTLAKLSKRYGPIFYLRLGSMHAVVVSNASLAKEFLSANDKIFASRPPSAAACRTEFGPKGMIGMAPYGPEWRHIRKLCSLQLFTNKRVKEFQPLFQQEISLQIQKIKHHQASNPGAPIDLTHNIANLIETIACRILLGKSLSEAVDVALGINLKEVAHRLTELSQIPMIGDFIPYLGFLDRRHIPSLDAVHRDLDVLLEGLIRDREDRRRKSEDDTQTLILDVLLDDLERESAKTAMTEMLVGAIDTSATVLDWAMAELLKNPHAMCKFQEELNAVVQEPEKMVEEAHLPNLVYMKAVIKETLRMHPPLPLLLPHMSMEACKVDRFTLPKGTRLLINAWAIGRDPKTWEDPERFMPERFLTEKGIHMDIRGQDFELLPFGSGRRSCPGLPLGIPLIQSVLSNLVHTFDWKSPIGHNVDLSERFGAVVNRSKPLLAIPYLR